MTKLKMPFLTKTTKASSKSDSLRTTIPKEIVGYFHLETHDILIWEISDKKIMIKKWDGEQ